MDSMVNDTNHSKLEHRGDWHLTSTGVGHHYRPGYYFPDSNFHSVLREPLPPNLAKQDEIPQEQKYPSTVTNAHDHKFLGGPYQNPLHRKAPGHWNVHYLKDHKEKLQNPGWRRPLTMGNQQSETQAQFNARPGLKDRYEFDPGPQPFILKDHHTNGPSKVAVASGENDKMKGRPFFVRDKNVLNLLDPYLSTTQRDHRAFKKDELKGYPKKDIATYWDCEEYPKAWGFGLKDNPLPKSAVPRRQLPMRDETWFKSETKIRRLPYSAVPVPHSGLRPLYKASYATPSDVKMKEIHFCPVDTPWTLPAPGPSSAMKIPAMYKTEYENIGSKKTITV
ncbi:stabilizer of axonemal microtubules 3-like [Tubulanus polymorphus]|uniref:stabilizer of axonemal microtubules 3-like n=1 Tax=Tubulanus polymorphus TaxID=672921 RepID=UPI003DA2470C